MYIDCLLISFLELISLIRNSIHSNRIGRCGVGVVYFWKHISCSFIHWTVKEIISLFHTWLISTHPRSILRCPIHFVLCKHEFHHSSNIPCCELWGSNWAFYHAFSSCFIFNLLMQFIFINLNQIVWASTVTSKLLSNSYTFALIFRKLGN